MCTIWAIKFGGRSIDVRSSSMELTGDIYPAEHRSARLTEGNQPVLAARMEGGITGKEK